MNSNKGFVFDIKKYSLHDGPGIRTTVFLKGCPLNCWWCHNPESQNLQPDIVPKSGKRRDFHTHYSDDQDAVGREVSADEIIQEVEKDIIFYDESNGGVTFSGGEPLMQPEFLYSLLSACKKLELHTAVDTTGYASYTVLERMLPVTDLFLYDLKLMDDGTHRKYTGVPMKPILDNLKALDADKTAIHVRVPIIPGITDGPENLEAIMTFLVTLKSVRHVALLPYNRWGESKYGRLNLDNKLETIAPPHKEVMESLRQQFEECGINVSIGG